VGEGQRRVRRRLRWTLVLLLCAACSAAPENPPSEPPPKLASDSGPVDLSKVKPNIPAAVRDTFTPLPQLKVERIPDAPPELLEAAEREEGISRFCYQEYGQKVDPKLVGAVALVVTVDGNAIQSVRVGAEDWSSRAGRGVNACLVLRAPQAWKLFPGAVVEPGRYVIQLRFRPS